MTRHLLDRFDMKHIKVDSTELGDQYDPEANAVRLTPDNFSGKSLTAVTMAAHEVGHVIQDHGGGQSATRGAHQAPAGRAGGGDDRDCHASAQLLDTDPGLGILQHRDDLLFCMSFSGHSDGPPSPQDLNSGVSGPI